MLNNLRNKLTRNVDENVRDNKNYAYNLVHVKDVWHVHS